MNGLRGLAEVEPGVIEKSAARRRQQPRIFYQYREAFVIADTKDALTLQLPVALHSSGCHLEQWLIRFDDDGVTFRFKKYRRGAPIDGR